MAKESLKTKKTKNYELSFCSKVELVFLFCNMEDLKVVNVFYNK